MEFEQNRMVQTPQNFELFDKKKQQQQKKLVFLTIFDKALLF